VEHSITSIIQARGDTTAIMLTQDCCFPALLSTIISCLVRVVFRKNFAEKYYWLQVRLTRGSPTYESPPPFIGLTFQKYSFFRNPAKQFADMHGNAKVQINKTNELQLA